MPTSIHHIERFDHFLKHATQLNRLYAPDDPLLDALELDAEAWQAASQVANPAPEVKAAIEARRSLHLLHRNFPAGEPSHIQAAYLLRGFTGLGPFNEANARTGWDYTAEMLQHGGRNLDATWDDARALATSLWMDLEGQAFGKEALLARDENFNELSEWFKGRIA